MLTLLLVLGSLTRGWLRSRTAMQLEALALRHQLAVYQRTAKRPRLRPTDRLLWSCLSRVWGDWRSALFIVKPRTVIDWRRRRFREHWTRLCRSGRPGRPPVSKEVRTLIRRMARSNPTWGAPRIVGELGKIGIHPAKSTVERYMPRRSTPTSPTWTTFLHSHLRDMVAVDFFVLPTVRNQILFAFLILAPERRRVLHSGVTANPTAEWTARQVVEAFQRQVRSLGMEEILTGPRKPWQNPHMERLIGSIRRECLDHHVILNERHLRRVLRDYLAYYHRWRTHLSLENDSPEHREIQTSESGRVVEVPELGGLHHHYERQVA